MVVDDSRQIRHHVARTLKEFEYTTIEAEHGGVCMELLKEDSSVDVILLDWNMPEMDGMETLEAIKANPQYDHIKIVMMTTENKSEKIMMAMDKGADEYIMKPLTKEVISEKLDSLDDDFI